MLPQKQQQASSSSRMVKGGAKYGALAGLIATWSISTAIAASELELQLPMGTFYAVMGASLGASSQQYAAYAGFGLHLLTGTALGAAIGFLAARYTPRSLFNPYRSLAIGLAAGMAVWAALFLPVTAFVVQPSLERAGAGPLLAAVGQPVWGIALSAIAFHLVWGAIFGYVTSALMRVVAFRAAHPQKKGGEGGGA